MENTSIYRLATKALKKISRSEEKLFFKVFKDYLKDEKIFFQHFTNSDFYFFFFYCYFMWKAQRVLSFEEVDNLMKNVIMAEMIFTSFDEVMETCENCGGDGAEDCPNCDKGKVECPDCDGMGELEDGEDCFNCSGTGEVECSICDGEGTFECDYCDGKGEVEEEGQAGIVKHIKFTTNEDDYQNVVESYEKSEPLSENEVDNLTYLSVPFDSTIPFNDTYELDENSYYVQDLSTNTDRIGSLIKYVYYQDFPPGSIFDFIFER